jgi:hypothetical protein
VIEVEGALACPDYFEPHLSESADTEQPSWVRILYVFLIQVLDHIE